MPSRYTELGRAEQSQALGRSTAADLARCTEQQQENIREYSTPWGKNSKKLLETRHTPGNPSVKKNNMREAWLQTTLLDTLHPAVGSTL